MGLIDMNIIVKKYEHYNRSMGKYIRSKKHYQEEMAKGGYVPAEEGHRMAERVEKERKWNPSKKCVDICRETMSMGDAKGNITLGKHPRLVKAMESAGMSFKVPSWLPTHYDNIPVGGFKDVDGKGN